MVDSIHIKINYKINLKEYQFNNLINYIMYLNLARMPIGLK